MGGFGFFPFFFFLRRSRFGGKGRRQQTGPRPDAGYTRPRVHRTSTRWKLRDGAALLTEAAPGLRPRVGTAGGRGGGGGALATFRDIQASLCTYFT